MNTNELILQLQRATQFSKGRMDDWQVVIPVYQTGSVGGTPCVSIKIVNSGIDWDKGKIFIQPNERLRIIDADEIKKLQDKYEELGWKLSDIRNLKSENKKLRKRIEQLEINNSVEIIR